jgi:hypothetical protein
MATKTRNVRPTTVAFAPTSGHGYNIPLMYDDNTDTYGYITASSIETHVCVLGGFDFSWLPDDANVTGISLYGYGYRGATSSSYYCTAALVKDSTSLTDNTDLGDGNVKWINSSSKQGYTVHFPTALSICTPSFLKSGVLELKLRSRGANTYIYELYLVVSYDVPPSVITVNASAGGSAAGGGTYEKGTTVTLTATPNTGYKFTQWSDGNKDNPRTIVVSKNIDLTAIFETKTYVITVNSTPVYGGSAIGSGTYDYGTTQTLTATPAIGYRFVKWFDGNPNNPRNIAISDDSEGAVYTAVFEKIVYEISVSGENGLVETHGERTFDTTVAITATPHAGYKFVRWSDGEISPNRFLTLSEDVINNIPAYIAEFEAVDLTLNTIDKVGDIVLTDSIITKQVTEFVDNNAIRVGDFAFYNCQNLSFLHTKKVNEIGKNAFNNCSQLLSVEMPLSVTGLGEYAFSNCVNLNALILPAAT